MTPFANTHVLEHPETVLPNISPAPRPVPPRKPFGEEHAAEHLPVPFQEALLEQHRFKSSSKPLDILVAFLFHVVLIGTPILIGLFYTDTINLKAFATTMLVAPPPPPPPPPAPAASVIKTVPIKRVFMSGGKLIAPTVIPKEVADIKEAPLPPRQLRRSRRRRPGRSARRPDGWSAWRRDRWSSEYLGEARWATASGKSRSAAHRWTRPSAKGHRAEAARVSSPGEAGAYSR